MRITLDIPYFAVPGLQQDANARGITPEEILLEILTELYGSFEDLSLDLITDQDEEALEQETCAEVELYAAQ